MVEGSLVINDSVTTKKIIFVTSVAILFLLFLYELMYGDKNKQLEVFFAKTDDLFADFINVQKVSAYNDPYHDTFWPDYLHQYPPLAFCLFSLASKFADFTTDATVFDIGYSSQNLIMIFYIFILVTAVYAKSLRLILKNNSMLNSIVAFSLLLSGIFLFSLERGNIIVLSALGVALFFCYFDSQKSWKRHLAFISLSVAAALKIYPALLGLILLYKKRWKDSFILMSYGILFFFVPFLFLDGGMSNLFVMISNAIKFVDNYKFVMDNRIGLFYILSFKQVLLDDSTYQLCKYINMFAGCMMLIVAGFQNIEWKQWASVTMVLVCLPEISFEYTILYLFPVIVKFLDSERSRCEYVYLILFILLSSPYQVFLRGTNCSFLILNLALLMIYAFLLFENVHVFLHRNNN